MQPKNARSPKDSEPMRKGSFSSSPEDLAFVVRKCSEPAFFLLEPGYVFIFVKARA